MSTSFDAVKKDKAAWRALQLWQILVGLAHNKQITTYKELAEILGFKGSGVFDKILGHIMFYCSQNGLPPLTTLVVNEKTGSPGCGLTEIGGYATSEAARIAVFKYEWFKLIPPTAAELQAAYKAAEGK